MSPDTRLQAVLSFFLYHTLFGLGLRFVFQRWCEDRHWDARYSPALHRVILYGIVR